MQPDPEQPQEGLDRLMRAATGLSSDEMAQLVRLEQIMRRTVAVVVERAALPPAQQRWVLAGAAAGLRARGLEQQAARLEDEARALDGDGAAVPGGGGTPPPTPAPPSERRQGHPDRRQRRTPRGALLAFTTQAVPAHLVTFHILHAGLLAILVRVVLVANS